MPSCANDWLLNDVLRGAWEFDGCVYFLLTAPSPFIAYPLIPSPFLFLSTHRYVTSDCDADNDVFYSHHYTNSPEQAVAAIVHAGTGEWGLPSAVLLSLIHFPFLTLYTPILPK